MFNKVPTIKLTPNDTSTLVIFITIRHARCNIVWITVPIDGKSHLLKGKWLFR